MKFNLILNKSGESISYRKIVQVPYALAEMEPGITIVLDDEIKIFRLFKKYDKKDISIYHIEDKLLISFNKEDFYYMLYEIPENYSKIVKKENKIRIIFSNKNMNYLLVFNEISLP